MNKEPRQPTQLMGRAFQVAFALLCFSVAPAHAQSPDLDQSVRDETGYPITTVHTRDDYGQHDQNWDIMQADNGLMYVANGHGLMERDGERWRTYFTPSRTRLRAITRWHDGHIYTGTTNDLGYYRPTDVGGLEYVSLITDWAEEDKNFGEVWALASNSKWVVFSSIDRLFVYDGDSIRVVADFEPGTYRVFSVNDRILIKQQESPNLLELTGDGDSLQMEVVSNQLPAESFPMGIDAVADGWVVVTGEQGVIRIDAQSRSVLHEASSFGDGVVLFSSHVGADGYHYIGSLKHGLFVINPEGQLIRNFQQAHGLGTNTLLAISEDNQGNIWLAGAPAITQLVPTHRYSRHVTEDNSQSLNFVMRHQGKVLLGGFGFYVMTENENPLLPPVFRVIEGTINNQVWDAIGIGDEMLLATNHGVVRVELNDDAQMITEQVIAESAFAYDVDQVGDSNVFFAATHDGLTRIERTADGVWQETRLQGVDRAIRQVVIENADTIWASAEDNKLFRVSGVNAETGEASIQRFDGSDGIGDSEVFPVMLDGEIHFGSPQGLLDYQAEAQPPFDISPDFAPLFEDPVADVDLFWPDSQGRIWYQADERRFLAVPSGKGWDIFHQFFTDLPNRTLQSVFEYDQDSVWVVFEEAGVLTVSADSLGRTDAAATLHIRSVRDLASNEAYYLGYGPATLPELTQQNNSIRISFALADFSSNADNEYRTRLLGSSADQWSDWSGESSKDYTLLGGGDYEFQVQAKDRSGQLSAPAGFAFVVSPHWYLSRAAISLYLLAGLFALALSVFAGSKWRKRKTRAQQQKLTALVTERTAELARANEKLEILANSDGLTGLANRRQFDAYLEGLVGRGTEVTLVLLDVDHFKQFNDAKGHLAGDDLLKSLAQLLREQRLPEQSLVARYGGEEFVIVLPAMDAKPAGQMAGQLRGAVQEQLGVTVSIGVAQQGLNTQQDIKALIEAADNALYSAKQAGRNRVVSLAS